MATASPYRRDDATLLMFGLLAFYNGLLNGLGPLMPFLRDEFGLSHTVGSLHFSAFAAGMLLVGAVGDRVIARLGRRRSLWVGAWGMACGAVGLIVGRNAAATIASCFAMSAVGSLLIILVGASLSDRHGGNGAVAIGEANIFASVAAGIAPLLVGFGEGSGIGWRFALAVPIALLTLLTLRFRSAAIPAAHPAPAHADGSAPLPRSFWIYWLALTLGVAVEFSLIYFGADFLHEAAGLSKSAAATTMSLFLWGMVAGRIAGSRIVGRIHPARLLPGAIAVTTLGFLVYWLAPWTPVVVAGLFVAGLGVANIYPLTMALGFRAAAGRSDAAGARMTFASGAAILTAPLLLGVLSDAVGISRAYGIVPLLLLALLGAILLAGRWSPSAAETAMVAA